MLHSRKGLAGGVDPVVVWLHVQAEAVYGQLLSIPARSPELVHWVAAI